MTECNRGPRRKIDRVRRPLSLALAAGLLLALAPTVDPDGTTATASATAASASAAAPNEASATASAQPGASAAPGQEAGQETRPGQGRPTQQELDELKTKANEQPGNRVRVIVGLNTPAPFTPEADLPANQRAQQRNNIATQRQALRQELPDHELIQEYETVPYVALELPAQAVEALGRSNRVASVQEDEAVAPTLGTSAPLVQANTMWSQGHTGSGVMVAVLDTGIQTNHSAFGGRVTQEACYSPHAPSQGIHSPCPGNATSITGPGTGGPCGFASTCGHGTHVGGIVASNHSSYRGVARASNLMSAQIFTYLTTDTWCGQGASPCYRSFTSAQMAALERVYTLRNTHNFAAVNMSLGGGRHTSNCDNDSRKAVIDNLRAVGIATVIASGNDGYKNAVGAPACISSAVSVGATTKTDVIASFSNNHQTLVDLLAPGVSIRSAYPGNASAIGSGTSMAAPHVAGAFALLRQAKPQLSTTQALADLKSTGLQVTDSRSGGSSYANPRIRIADAANVVSTGNLNGRIADHEGNSVNDVTVQLHNDAGLVAETTTLWFGWYSFPGVWPGSDYRVRFSHDSFGVIWAHGALDKADADQFTVTAGQTTTVNEQLPAPPASDPATISGTVSGPDGPLPNVDVRLHDTSVVATTATDQNGAYELTDLDVGVYTLEFDPSAAHPDLEPQWWDGAESQDTATPIELASGTTLTGINAALTAVPPATTGDITGTVTDHNGPLADVWVLGYDSNARIVSIALTDTDGAYRLAGLEPGDYRVRYYHSSFGNVWWRTASTYAAAEPITLTSDGATANLDLGALPAITGTVTDHNGPVVDVSVRAYDTNTKVAAQATTDADGTYSLDGLKPGDDYRVQYLHPSFTSQWWPNAVAYAAAEPITLTSDGATANLDLAAFASIVGTVSDGGGPVAHVYVMAYDTDAELASIALTGADGTYTLAGFDPGDYRVRYYHSSFGSLWWRTASTYATADPIALTSDGAVANLDLDALPAITGTVTDDGPLAGVSVRAYDTNAKVAAQATTDADGAFSLDGLKPGDDYRIQYLHPSFTSQWWPNAATYATAEPVTLTSDGATADLDLAAFASIVGTVSDSGGPVANVWVWAYDANADFASIAITGADGTYRLAGFDPGDYRVRYYHSSFGSLWWRTASTFAAADPITLTTDDATANLDLS